MCVCVSLGMGIHMSVYTYVCVSVSVCMGTHDIVCWSGWIGEVGGDVERGGWVFKCGC